MLLRAPPLQPNAAAYNLTPTLKFSVRHPKGNSHPDENKRDAASAPTTARSRKQG